MMFGFLPPSSSETFLNNGAQASATLRPVTVPPVNEIVPIFGCAVIAAPTFGPVPCTTLRTPFGNPASRTNLAKQISRHRREFARLGDGGVPDGNGRRDFPAQQIERQVPRRNQSGDAARLPQRVVERDAVGDVRFGFRVQDRGGEEAEIARGARNVEGARERKRLAGIDRFGAREFFQIALDQVGDAEQEFAIALPPIFSTNRQTPSLPRRQRASTSRASLSATCEYGLPVAGSMLSRYFPPTGSTNWPSMKFWICGDSVRTPEFKRSIRLRQPGAQTKGESRRYGVARVSTSNSETHFKDEHGYSGHFL